jgi:hypothetical protein
LEGIPERVLEYHMHEQRVAAFAICLHELHLVVRESLLCSLLESLEGWPQTSFIETGGHVKLVRVAILGKPNFEVKDAMRIIAKHQPIAPLEVEQSDNIPCDGAKALPPETMTEQVLRESGGKVIIVPEKDFATKPVVTIKAIAGEKGMAMMRGEHVESDPPEKIAAFLEEERKHHIGE